MSAPDDGASDAISSTSYTRARAYLVDDVDELQLRLGLPGLKRAFISIETVRETLYAHTMRHWDNDHEMTLVALTWCRMCEDAKISAHIREDPKMLEYLASLTYWTTMCYLCTLRSLVHWWYPCLARAKGDNLITELALTSLSNILSDAAESKDEDTIVLFLEAVFYMTTYTKDVGRITFNRTAVILTDFLNQRCMPVWIDAEWAESCIYYSVGLARQGTGRQRRIGLRNLAHFGDPTPLYDWEPEYMARSLQRLELTSEMRTSMRQFGLEKCETTRVLRNMSAVGDAVNEAFTDDGPPNLARLGLRLCDLVRADPICVCFDDNFPRRARLGTGGPRKYGAQFDEWADLLTNCAAAVRQLPGKSVLLPISGAKSTTDDVADILDIQHHLLNEDCFCTELDSIRRLAFERNSSEMFYLFTVLRSPDLDLALSASKLVKGSIKCEDPGPFDLIFMACLALGLWEGVLKVDIPESNTVKGWRKIVRGAHSALEYANLYLRACPPDALYRDRMFSIKALAMQLIHGPGSKLLSDTKGFLRPSRLAHEFYGAIWKEDGTSESYDALRNLVEHGPFVGKHMDPPLKKLFPGITPSNAADEFERGDKIPRIRQFSEEVWEEWKIPVDADRNVDWKSAPRGLVHNALISPYAKDLELYSCDNCEARSAALRRCALCREVRYCDRDCQSEAWGGHREICSRVFL
ncbi:hypothetical protein EXIGLDRAFT_763973 [Exidia glandulosa HHB12029]|uniref:MYND-type domain-containing protein n=1 Tax=Exidia glandulosa HHB12029 TaxID=1314781 RepID=A0A166B502_EXIGL|nr:hypothetical protein EXIGLDRAFT_763973 [Exidia glandulosa HHB12029]